MRNAIARQESRQAERQQLVTMTVAGRLLGLPILEVHDIVVPERITPVPLSSPEVAGLINLRGKIVTAIDMRRVLHAPPVEEGAAKRVGVTIGYRGETYTLLVDSVGEVVELLSGDFEANPPTLDQRWKHLSNGVFRMKEGLLVVLNTDRVMEGSANAMMPVRASGRA